jgi:thiamine pyrophosphate-dependent acetolactate synthase large subunit-like protein
VQADSPWLQALAAERTRNQNTVAAFANSDASPINLYRMFRDIHDVLDRDATVTVDGERTMAVSRALASAYLPRHRLDAGTSGCMGVAVPYAIGAQIARPGRQVLSINGDWAFGFNGMEVETAVRHNLPIVFLVANNGTTGLINSARMFSIAPGDPFDVVRYDRLMEAFGGHGAFVETAPQLKPALERAFASGRTALINVVVDPTADRKPQSFDWLRRDSHMQY